MDPRICFSGRCLGATRAIGVQEPFFEHHCVRGHLYIYFFYYCIFIMFSRFTQGCSMCQYFISLFHFFTYFISCRPGSSLRLKLFSICSEQDCSSLKCLDLSLRWRLLLCSAGSRHTDFSSCGSHALESRLSSRGTWA